MAGADRMTIEEVVKQVMVREHGDVVRAALEAVCRGLMEGEVSELVGAELGERTPDRATHRNGYRARRWDTRPGEIELQFPQAASGQLLPVVPGAAQAFRAGARGRWSSTRMYAGLDPSGRPAGRVAGYALGGQPELRLA